MRMLCGTILVMLAMVGGTALAACEESLSALAARYADAAAAGCGISKAAAFAASQNPDGSWSDIDYASKARSRWPAADHLRVRLRTLAADWRINGKEESLAAAHKALGFWLRKRFKNPNWWWNVIGVPQSIGDAALMLDEKLSPDERVGVLKIMDIEEPKFAKTGQNMAWMAENRLRRGLIARDDGVVRGAFADILGQVRMGNAEGIRSDWCFHQHGEQPQFGNYGLSFIVDQSRLAAIFSGTCYEYPPEKMDLLRSLASEGYSWICWKGMMDVSAMGRQLGKGSQCGKAASVERAFANLEKTGWKRPMPRIGFCYFDKSAYAVYRTGRFMASVKASTPRIIGTETWINEDNAKGMCMADGALMTYVTGHEYENALPLWDDWRMVPGVTGYLGKPVNRKDSRNKRDDIIAAASGDGGSFEFTFEREGLVAHKKWTFSPSGIVCEGTGISASDGRFEVATSVEHSQAVENAGVVYQREGESCFRNGALVYTVYAPKEAIRFEVADREGNFNTFMLSDGSSPVRGKVFSLRIIHGKKPVGASYRYVVSVDE